MALNSNRDPYLHLGGKISCTQTRSIRWSRFKSIRCARFPSFVKCAPIPRDLSDSCSSDQLDLKVNIRGICRSLRPFTVACSPPNRSPTQILTANHLIHFSPCSIFTFASRPSAAALDQPAPAARWSPGNGDVADNTANIAVAPALRFQRRALWPDQISR
jgi:hypothetical protein